MDMIQMKPPVPDHLQNMMTSSTLLLTAKLTWSVVETLAEMYNDQNHLLAIHVI